MLCPFVRIMTNDKWCSNFTVNKRWLLNCPNKYGSKHKSQIVTEHVDIVYGHCLYEMNS